MPTKGNSKTPKLTKPTEDESNVEELTSSEASHEKANVSPDTYQDAIILSMKEEFSTMREDFTTKFQGLMGAIGDVKNDIKTLSSRIGDAEERISSTEDELACLTTQASAMKTTTDELARKVDDLENRSRRSNLRLVGLPEFKEQHDMCEYLEKWIPNTLGHDNFPRPLIIERAHRVGGQVRRGTSGNGEPTTRPRAVVMKFLNFADKVRVFQAAKKKGDIFVDKNKVMFFPDLSADLLKRRKVFDSVKKELATLSIRGLQYGIVYPATLLVTVGGKRHTFDTKAGAETFLQGLKRAEGGYE